jgi:hypothetical protein
MEICAGAALVHPLAAQRRHDGGPVAMCQHAPAVGLLGNPVEREIDDQAIK